MSSRLSFLRALFPIFSALALFLKTGAIGVAAQSAVPVETSIWKIEVEPKPSEPGKYAIKGSVFGIGDPVHETLTLNALIGGGMAPAGTARKSPSVVQYMRGVFWNDDPCAQLFTENDFVRWTLRSASFGTWISRMRARRTASARRSTTSSASCLAGAISATCSSSMAWPSAAA